jgi:hypothetical protein
LCALLLLAGTILHAESPTESVDRLWDVWSEHHDEDSNVFNEKYVRFSKDVADVQGAAVIAPIMKRAKEWTSDEVLVFVGVVAFIPQENSRPILERYKKFGRPWERQCATDLLIELEAPDVKEMVTRETSAEEKP